MQKVVEKVRETRTAWLARYGVPISKEFVDFANAVGDLCDAALMASPQKTDDPNQDPGSTPWRTALATGRKRMPDGSERVMLVILRDDTLQLTTFLKPDDAENLAEQLLRTAQEIKTGLVIPQGKILAGG